MARTVGLGLAAVGAAAGIAALGIGSGWGAGSWGPRAVPLLAAGALVLAGLAESRAAGPAPTAGPAQVSGDERSAWALLAIAVLYVLLLGRMGFLVSTMIAAPAVFWLFGGRGPTRLLAAAILLPLALHAVFFRFLGVFPPRGSWFDLLDLLPL